MKKIVTSSEMKEIERRTIEEIGIPSLVLMERAAMQVVSAIGDEEAVLVVCGVGNNGADGLAVARLLKLAGKDVRINIVGNVENATEEFKLQKAICDKLGVRRVQDKFITPDVIVDAIFGIGLSREVTGEYYDAIEFINGYKLSRKDKERKCKVISVDIPSGLDCNHGVPLGIAVCANETVTFTHEKLGLILNEGPRYAGKVTVADCGIITRDEDTSIAFTYDEDDVNRLPERDKLGNKGTFGKVLLVTGSVNMPGASIITARAAFKSGAGMVKVLSSRENRDLLMHELPEAMFQAYEDMTVEDLDAALNWCDACLIGPGLNVSDLSKYLVDVILEKCKKPVVLDADGLNIQASKDLSGIRARGERGLMTILTPHPREFARLTSTDMQSRKSSDIEFVNAIARNNYCLIAAKDARTVVAKGSGAVYINTVTSDSLATAGSGDIYAAIITSLIAGGINPFEATCLATLIHGLAGKHTECAVGSASSSASDILNSLGKIIN